MLTEDDEDAITLAFDKSRSDDRKQWLKQYDKNDSFNINVNKSEDENELDMSSFWKDIINAMRRKNIEN